MTDKPVPYVTEPTALALTPQELAELDTIPGRELMKEGQPPFIRVSQRVRPINDDNAGVGKLYDSLTGLFYDTLQVALVSGQPKGQLKYPVDFHLENPAECSSDDGENPITYHERRATAPLAGPCSECPDAQWLNGQPRCAEQEKLLLYVQGEPVPRLISFHRTAINPGRALGQLLIVANARRHFVTLGVFLTEKKGRQWHLPVSVLGEPMSAQESRALLALRQGWKEFKAKADLREEPPVSAASQADDGGPPLDNYDGPPLQDDDEESIPF